MQAKESLRQLLLKHIQGVLSESEREQLFASLGEEGTAEDWKALIRELSTELTLDAPYREQEWEPMIQQILSARGEEDAPDISRSVKIVRRIHPLRRGWVRYAAAVFLVAGLGTAVFLARRRPSAGTVAVVNPVIHDALPGGNKAVLKLANGQTIVLDAAANGSLAMQGNTRIVKLSNGQVVYTPDGADTREVLYNTMSTPRGGQYKLTLPDGTGVWLNSASSITYPTAFTGPERNIVMTGEAYFEVVKDNARPFHVRVSGQDVLVLGTHFNINSYEESAKTTLLEGSVKVTNGNSVVLRPGQQAVGQRAQLAVLNQVDLEQVMAWKEGLFNFEGADLKSVVSQLGRWYDVDVVFEGGAIPDRKFGGEMPMDLNLSQVLKVLEKMEIRFRVEGKKLIVMP